MPQLASFEDAGADEFFLLNLERAYDGAAVCGHGRVRRFVSLGAGNCDLEVRLAEGLRASGRTEFVFDCLDLNAAMIERGAAAASEKRLAGVIQPLVADFNAWRPEREYDAVVANQALHHVVELERLLEGVPRALSREGKFIVSDMVGRNGHRRWPEALELVEKFWRELPARYRYDRQLRRQDEAYPDFDCSKEGFEGIRWQDILPLALERFGFEFFYAFSNVTDPFADRSYGPNFDAEGAWDREFIDRVHPCDEAEIRYGRITPTHMLAVMGREQDAELVCREHLTPAFCVRRG